MRNKEEAAPRLPALLFTIGAFLQLKLVYCHAPYLTFILSKPTPKSFTSFTDIDLSFAGKLESQTPYKDTPGTYDTGRTVLIFVRVKRSVSPEKNF
jgi:hypothetical protein